jgi:hypothetical protein
MFVLIQCKIRAERPMYSRRKTGNSGNSLKFLQLPMIAIEIDYARHQYNLVSLNEVNLAQKVEALKILSVG